MISIILFLIFVAIDAIVDKDLIRQEKDVHTLKQYILRGVIITLFAVFTPDRIFILSLLSYCLVYWWSFDAVMGILLKRNPLYLGDGFLDELQKNSLGVLPWFFFKALAALGGAIYIIKPSLYQIQYSF
jgi:hypothetical protein